MSSSSQDSFYKLLFADGSDSPMSLMDMNQDEIPDAMNEPSLMPNNDTDFAKELSRNLLKHAGSEAQLQDDMIEPLLSPNNKEKLSPMRSGSSTGSITKRKGKGKGKISTKKARRSFNVGESSKPSEQPEAEPKGKEDPLEELMKNKSILQVLKVFNDRVNRRINNDFKAYGIACMCLMRGMTKNSLLHFLHSLYQIQEKTPVLSDLENIKKTIKEMEKEEHPDKKKHIATDEMKWRLKEVEEAIKRSDEERRKEP